MFKDYYQILGIEYPSNPVEIRGAYHLQSMKWHPDKNPGRDTKQQMQDVNEAYASRSRSSKNHPILITTGMIMITTTTSRMRI